MARPWADAGRRDPPPRIPGVAVWQVTGRSLGQGLHRPRGDVVGGTCHWGGLSDSETRFSLTARVGPSSRPQGVAVDHPLPLLGVCPPSPSDTPLRGTLYFQTVLCPMQGRPGSVVGSTAAWLCRCLAWESLVVSGLIVPLWPGGTCPGLCWATRPLGTLDTRSDLRPVGSQSGHCCAPCCPGGLARWGLAGAVGRWAADLLLGGRSG